MKAPKMDEIKSCLCTILNMFMFKLELRGVFLGFGIFYAALDAFFFIKYSHSVNFYKKN